MCFVQTFWTKVGSYLQYSLRTGCSARCPCGRGSPPSSYLPPQGSQRSAQSWLSDDVCWWCFHPCCYFEGRETTGHFWNRMYRISLGLLTWRVDKANGEWGGLHSVACFVFEQEWVGALKVHQWKSASVHHDSNAKLSPLWPCTLRESYQRCRYALRHACLLMMTDFAVFL